MHGFSCYLILLFFAIAALEVVGVTNSSAITGPINACAAKTCTRLQAQLGSVIVQTSGTEYLQASSGAWNLYNTVDLPTCIVFPRATVHVQTTMKAIFRDQVHYAVQAGGHSAMLGWNTVGDGILIVFSHMTNVSYDPVKDTISIQPGIHWGDALADLQASGVAPLGGRLGDVGTGLLLGGGLNYLAAEHGFSSDQFVKLDVVLVNGQLVTATAKNEHADLFRALKGGANRFGIVTRYEVTAIHTGTAEDKNWFGGILMFPNSSSEALLQATTNYVNNVADSKAALLVVFTNSVNGSTITPIHLVTLFYHGSSLPDSIFGEFLAIPATSSSLGPLSWLEVNNVLGAGADRGFGQLFGASAFSGELDQYTDSFRRYNQFMANVKDNIAFSVLAFTPIQKSQVLVGKKRGGNPMDPPLRNYAAVQFQTQMPLGATTLPPDLVENARQLFLSQIPRSADLPLYINECDAKQNVFSTYVGFELLKSTYAKYDPTRFNVRFTDGPIGL